ncbi:hypothetical protein CBL_06104 [Carabus blaptoides fortunei]
MPVTRTNRRACHSGSLVLEYSACTDAETTFGLFLLLLQSLLLASKRPTNQPGRQAGFYRTPGIMETSEAHSYKINNGRCVDQTSLRLDFHLPITDAKSSG